MKTLRKLEINPERLMKDEEMMTLRGGYGYAYCRCLISGSECYADYVENCGTGYGSCDQACSYYCPNVDEHICTGW